MDRIKVLHESKFKRMTDSEMAKVNGGLCISCVKRTRKIKIGSKVEGGCTVGNSYRISGEVTVGIGL